MTPLWTSHEIAAACGGAANTPFSAYSVAFDSREAEPGGLFVALRGAATDGHCFLDSAMAAGVTGALVSEQVPHPHVLVADTQAALEALARAARARAANATIVGVTGSAGKTGVKEALRAAFELQGPTHASVKSYNNHTGVPLSLARMPADTRWGVFEMGMNHGGEIARLTAQVRPHVALITTVGTAHIENFEGPDGIADAKAEIFSGLEQGGAAVIPYDTPHRDRLIAGARAHASQIITFGVGEGAAVRAVHLAEDGAGSDVEADVRGERVKFRISMAGRHRVRNVLAVLAAVSAAGGALEPAVEVARKLTGMIGRGRVLAVGGARILDEVYNANPDSMAAAIATLGMMPAARKLAVIGSMRELGGHSDAAHAALAPLLARAEVERLILVGPETAPLAHAWPGAVNAPDVAAAIEAARAELREGDLMLVKGSNSVGLGRLVAALETDHAL